MIDKKVARIIAKKNPSRYRQIISRAKDTEVLRYPSEKDTTKQDNVILLTQLQKKQRDLTGFMNNTNDLLKNGPLDKSESNLF